MRDFLDIPFGYRYIGYYEQEVVKSRKDIIKVIEEHLSVDNIALSISTYKDNHPHLLFMPFDFDSDDLRKAWDDAKRLYNYFVRENYGAYLTFSGRKGFHVLVITDPKVYTRKQLRVCQRHFKNLLSLNTVDEQIFGDVRRLMRIPGTYNIKGGLCKVLAHNIGKEFDLDEIYEYEEPVNNYNVKSNGDRQFHDYPCIESLIRLDSEPRHMIRFTYVILRLDEGYSPEEILSEIETFGWQDFNEYYTMKQIQHIDGRGYVPPSCSTLRELGFCNVENCEFRRDNNNALKEVGII